MQAVPQARFPQSPPDEHLGFRVDRSDARHDLGAREGLPGRPRLPNPAPFFRHASPPMVAIGAILVMPQVIADAPQAGSTASGKILAQRPNT